MRYYWTINFIYNLILYFIVTFVVILIGLAFQLNFFTETSGGILFLMFFGWGINQISFGFFLSTFFSKARTSTSKIRTRAFLLTCFSVVCYLLVLFSILPSQILFSSSLYFSLNFLVDHHSLLWNRSTSLVVYLASFCFLPCFDYCWLSLCLGILSYQDWWRISRHFCLSLCPSHRFLTLDSVDSLNELSLKFLIGTWMKCFLKNMVYESHLGIYLNGVSQKNTMVTIN